MVNVIEFLDQLFCGFHEHRREVVPLLDCVAAMHEKWMSNEEKRPELRIEILAEFSRCFRCSVQRVKKKIIERSGIHDSAELLDCFTRESEAFFVKNKIFWNFNFWINWFCLSAVRANKRTVSNWSVVEASAVSMLIITAI